MDLQFKMTPCPYLRMILQAGKSQEESCDVIVPDTEADAERVIGANASAYIRSRECRSGALTVSGGIRAYCLYETDGSVRSCDAYIPFSVRFDHPSVDENCRSILQCAVESVEARLSNSRKLTIRARVGVTAQVFSESEQAVSELTGIPDSLRLRQQQYTLMLPSQTGEKAFSVSEELALPAGKTATAVCGVFETAQIEKQNLLGTRAIFKGELQAKILYLDEGGNPNTLTQRLPFSQFIDLPEDYEQQQLRLVMLCTGLEAQMQQERICVSAELTAQCLVTREQTVTIYEDAYAIGQKLNAVWTDSRFFTRLDAQQTVQGGRLQLSAPVQTVVDCTVYLQSPTVSHEGDTAQVSVPAEAAVLYYDRDGALQQSVGKTQLRYSAALEQKAQCGAFASLLPNSSASGNSGGAEVSFDAEVMLDCYADMQLKSLQSGVLSENEAQGSPAVIVKTVQGGCTVWELAKQYAADMQQIMDANGLTQTELDETMLLMIPVNAMQEEESQ